MRRAQLSFGDGLIAGEVSDLREGWMAYADRVLADEHIVAAVYEALARRHPKSRSRGRLGAPAEVVLRLLILKHVRNWSYHVLEREVRYNGRGDQHPPSDRQHVVERRGQGTDPHQ
jgi:IS5 family transposase